MSTRAQPSLPERPFLLANPASGRGRGAAALNAALAVLSARGIAPTVLRTERPAHAVELARRAAGEGADLLFVLGGDGTVRDAVEGLAGADVPVGLLPGGTGNDLARTLGIPREPEGAVTAALSGAERMLDVWLWNGTPFVNIAGVGLDAAVAGAVNRRFRRLRGTLAYVAAFCVVLPGFKQLDLELRWPGGEWAGRAWLAAFASARYYGGGMMIAPEAVPDDGLLDITVVGDTSRLELLRNLPGLFAGRHVHHPSVHTFRVESVELTAAPQETTIDGELIGATPAVILRAPYGLRVRVPGE